MICDSSWTSARLARNIQRQRPRSGSRRKAAPKSPTNLTWRRRASYPELPGAVGEAESAIDAMDQADERRVAIILDRLERGAEIPVPRPPLP